MGPRAKTFQIYDGLNGILQQVPVPVPKLSEKQSSIQLSNRYAYSRWVMMLQLLEN